MRHAFALLLVLGLTMGIACNTKKNAVQAPAPAFTITGTLTSGAGDPVRGETVCILSMVNENVTMDYTVGGGASEPLDPHADTDTQGHFTINVGSDFMEKHKQPANGLTVTLALFRKSQSTHRGFLHTLLALVGKESYTMPTFLPITKDGQIVKLGLVASGSETSALALGTLTASPE